ncbi:MAG TPA: fibronectin/fibrinogen-binding protein, partial [Clostridiaceae bacterium]|nr:fibronectin/fibrinogen-binding protein [Clostridiaceae bacterium]
MPFDGVFTNSIVKELSEFVEGKIDKVYQPSKDEIILIVKKDRKNIKLLLSANPSFPRVHITYSSMENPKAPPNFCMALRKHILGGIIKSVSQVNFDRIIQFEIEGLTELGDAMQYKLICEIMGKHSNILLLNNENTIVDCIKHIGHNMNRYREIMPGADYVMPP